MSAILKNPAWASSSVLAPIVAAALAVSSPPARSEDRAAPAPKAQNVVETVQSRDGTRIAYERSGQGPVLILVGPALSDRTDSARLASLLARSFTVINYDRRGRGASGDTKPYAVEREIEDIDALIEKTGETAFLFGSSSGAVLALEAANRLTRKVTALVLFEPPFVIDDSRPPIPEKLFEEIGSLIARDRRGEAVALFMTKAAGVPEEMLASMKKAPMWAGMEKRAHTLLHDGAILAGLQSGKPLPAKRWTSVSARTLVIDGERSDPYLRNAVKALAEVLPGARRQTLEGQDHSAPFRAPRTLAPAIAGFLGGK